MQHAFARSMLAAWVPITLALFRTLGPRRAAMISVLAGFSLLPGGAGGMAMGWLTVEKRTIPGLALALAVLAFDRKALGAWRPRWIDLPMALFVASPLVGSAVHGGRDLRGAVDQSWIHLFEWAMPYAAGRLYLGGGNGPRSLAIAVVVAGLLYVPPVVFEAIAGPRYRLAGLVYGQWPAQPAAERLGGLRFEAFLGSGLELAAWMAVATSLGVWMAACRDRWRPALYAAPAMVLASLLCRSLYGYATLAIGLLAAAITLGLGTRWALAALLLVPPVYAVARGTGLWDGRVMIEAERVFSRQGTLGVRIQAEDDFVRDTRRLGLAFGAGGGFPAWQSDGWWVSTLKGGGIAGLAAFYAAFGLPAALTIFRRPPRSAEAGLALVIVLHLIDGLHNTSVLPTTLLGGALLGAPPVARRDDGGGAVGTVRYRIR